MSLGVNLLVAVTRRVAEALDEDFDIEIVEMHHRRQGRRAIRHRADARRSRRRGARRSTLRSARSGFATASPVRAAAATSVLRALRGGSVVGEHKVIFAGAGERIELTHIAGDRSVFARGAVKAAAVGPRQGTGPLLDDRRAGALSLEIRPVLPNDQRSHTLVLVRHGESEWNQRNLFTGWCNPDLTEKGLIEALVAARMLRSKGISFDVAYSSQLKRAQRTLDIILSELGQTKIPIHFDEALNERHYGDLCGLNKDEARERWGEEQVEVWRRSYDIPPPGGESLKDTEERVMPYYKSRIWPDLQAGKKVLLVAHGNSLRALIMNLEGLTGEEILERELATGAPIVYQLGADGLPTDRSDLLPARSIDAHPEDIV